MGGGGGRGRGGSRTQRRHFRQNRENVWKRPKSDPSSENNPENNGENRGWQPFATQNPAFDEYYKVISFTIYTYIYWMQYFFSFLKKLCSSLIFWHVCDGV